MFAKVSDQPALLVVRWLARFAGLVGAGVVALIAVGEGFPNPLRMSPQELALLICLFVTWCGLLVGWRWELAGALMILGGMALFYAIELLDSGRFPRGWFLPFLAAPGFLFLYCWLATRRALGQKTG
jgi:hypothetical protein